jgi:hypothetical protein
VLPQGSLFDALAVCLEKVRLALRRIQRSQQVRYRGGVVVTDLQAQSSVGDDQSIRGAGQSDLVCLESVPNLWLRNSLAVLSQVKQFVEVNFRLGIQFTKKSCDDFGDEQAT